MSAMVRYGSAIVCYEPMEERKRESDGERWCFYCHKRREFLFIVTAPIGISYYGPNPSIRCSVCDTSDGDLFPGRERTWGDDL